MAAPWSEVARVGGALELPPFPEERFSKLLAFAGIDDAAKRRMYLDAERLLEHAADWIKAAYDALARFPDTARALGWESRVPEDELRIRRTFFSAWMGRTIGVDTSREFARYLHQAGRVHAGYGPEKRFVPPEWVSMAYAYVLNAFSAVVEKDRVGLWAAYLAAQEEVMRQGFEAAMALSQGRVVIEVEALGIARPALPEPLEVRLVHGTVREALEKVFAFEPNLADQALEAEPVAVEEGLWMEEGFVYALKPRWTVLVGGRDVRYLKGLDTRLKTGERLTLLPPGR